MSIVPSKKRLEASSSSKAHIDVLDNLANGSSGQPYSMLMQIYKKSISDGCFQTPLKKSKTRKTNIYWTLSTLASQKDQMVLSSWKKLSTIRHRIEARRQKINMLTAQTKQVCEYRLKVNKCKIQILESIKSRQQIEELYKEGNIIIKQISNQIEQIKKQVLFMQKQVEKAIQNTNILDSKIKQMKESHQKLEQIRSNLSHAVSSQLKKNNNLKARLQSSQKKIMQGPLIEKLSNQLFVTLILTIQISCGHKKMLNNFGTQLLIDLCLNKNQNVRKIPYGLVVLAQIHMHKKLSQINVKYLNKISYFCDEAKKIFQFDRFRQMIYHYFEEKFLSISRQHEDFSNRQILSSKSSQNRKNYEEKEPKREIDNIQISNNSFEALINTSQNCECGKQLKQLFKDSVFSRILQKYFNIKTFKIKSLQQCSYIRLSKSEVQQGNIQNIREQKQIQQHTIVQR